MVIFEVGDRGLQLGINDTFINEDEIGDIGDQTKFEVGAGHIYEISPTARLNFDLKYSYAKVELDEGDAELKNTGLPLNIGAEVDATSWLVLRGSVTSDLFGLGEETINLGGTDTDDVSADEVYRVNLGATLNFGELKIDGNLGTTNALLTTDAFFGNAAVVYWF